MVPALALWLCMSTGPVPQEPKPLAVQVIEALAGDPVPGAELRWVPIDSQHFGAQAAAPDAFAVIVRDEFFRPDPAARTALDGRGQLERGRGPGFVCASRGAERGCVRVASQTEVSVRLLRDWPLEVEVVDPAGGALDGLGVCLRYSIGDEGKPRDAFATRVPIVDGLARIEHAGFFQGVHESGCSFHAGLTGWVGKPVQTWLPSFEPPNGRVRLTLPPYGSLELRVVDEDGKPSSAVDPLWIGEPGSLPADVAWPLPAGDGLRAGGQDYLVQPWQNGVARIARVQVGSRLEARARRMDDSFPSTSVCLGPARAGESTRAELHLGSGCATIRGRMQVPPGLSPIGLHVGPDGQFVFDIEPARDARQEHGFTFSASSSDGRKSASWFSWVQGALSPGVHDLGLIVLEDPPVIAAGVVVDAKSHSPLEGVRVVCLPEPPPDFPAEFVLSDAAGKFALTNRWSDSSTYDIGFRLEQAGGLRTATLKHVHRGTRGLRVELGAP